MANVVELKVGLHCDECIKKILKAIKKIEEFIPQPRLSEVESAQVEAAFALEDRSWVAISKDRRVSAMGKFGVKSDAERFKAAAKKKKEKGKSISSTPKRKEPEVEPSKGSKPSKKARTDPGPVEVGPIKKGPSSSVVMVGSATGDAAPVELPKGVEFEPLKLKEFLSEASKVFLKSPFDRSSSPSSSRDKLRLSFSKIISGVYDQFDAMSCFDSMEGPLKERIAGLESQLMEVEADLEKAREVADKTKTYNSELRANLTRSEDARQEISAELEEERERFDSEHKKFQDQILELQGLVAQQCEEIERLKVGDGLDLDAFIDSEAFEAVRDSIEDATGDELIRRIKEVHPDLDLSFLTVTEPSSTPAPDVERGTNEVEPKVAGEGGSG